MTKEIQWKYSKVGRGYWLGYVNASSNASYRIIHNYVRGRWVAERLGMVNPILESCCADLDEAKELCRLHANGNA